MAYVTNVTTVDEPKYMKKNIWYIRKDVMWMPFFWEPFFIKSNNKVSGET